MNRSKWAEKKAYQLIGKLDIDDFPINVEDITERLNITVIQQPFENNAISGLLYRDGQNVVIGVNSSHPPTRKRFTVAHEIGHYIMHEGNKLHVDNDVNFRVNFRLTDNENSHDIQEIEANAFAAALLMPEDLIKKAISELEYIVDLSSDYDDQIDHLASLFEVSKQALLIRLGKLGLMT